MQVVAPGDEHHGKIAAVDQIDHEGDVWVSFSSVGLHAYGYQPRQLKVVHASDQRPLGRLTEGGRVGGMRQGRNSPSGGFTPEASNRLVNAPFYLPNLIAGIAATVGVIVGSIGPWASVLAFTKNAMEGDGTITLILGAASGIALFTLLNLGRKGTGLRWLPRIAWGVAVAGLLCLVIAIIDIADIRSRSMPDVFGVTIRLQVEWGLWMVAICSPRCSSQQWSLRSRLERQSAIRQHPDGEGEVSVGIGFGLRFGARCPGSGYRGGGNHPGNRLPHGHLWKIRRHQPDQLAELDDGRRPDQLAELDDGRQNAVSGKKNSAATAGTRAPTAAGGPAARSHHLQPDYHA